MDQITHKALETLAMARSRRPNTKLTCFPFSYYYYRSKGTSLPRWRRGTVHRERPIVRSQMEEAQVVTPFHLLHHLLPHLHVNPKGTTSSLQSLFVQTTMEPLPHGLWSCSSKPLTGRTGHKLKDASATGTTGDTPFTGTLPLLPDKDSSQADDMPCRHPLH